MTTFFIADLHFGDEATCTKYRRPDGSPLRAFRNAAEMDAELIRRWNETVGDDDTVWVLGDLGRKPHFRAVAMLKGEKRLVAGNGDEVAEIARAGLFAEIRAVKSLPGLLLSHVPVHPSQLNDRTANVHGHLHAKSVPDPRYLCVSVEQTGFRPVCEGAIRTRLRFAAPLRQPVAPPEAELPFGL